VLGPDGEAVDIVDYDEHFDEWEQKAGPELFKKTLRVFRAISKNPSEADAANLFFTESSF